MELLLTSSNSQLNLCQKRHFSGKTLQKQLCLALTAHTKARLARCSRIYNSDKGLKLKTSVLETFTVVNFAVDNLTLVIHLPPKQHKVSFEMKSPNRINTLCLSLIE